MNKELISSFFFLALVAVVCICFTYYQSPLNWILALIVVLAVIYIAVISEELKSLSKAIKENTPPEYHWYLVSGISEKGNHNKPFGMVNRNITNANLKWFKELLCKQAEEYYFDGTSVNVVIISISYLGKMSKQAFEDEEGNIYGKTQEEEAS